MKDLMSTTERRFILAALADRKRVDGRELEGFRPLSIQFGADRGCCLIQLGETKVLSQVTCTVVTPKDSRPNDGVLISNIEFSPLCSLEFEAGRAQTVDAVETNRLLERCIRQSRCLDTESLCIVSGSQVWCLRVDVRVIACCGSIIDAASVAAICSLLHFRRPDVTACGTEITIHTAEKRDPVPLTVLHVPVCVTVAFFEKSMYSVVDPTDKEEKVMDGRMVVGMNKHREICLLQVAGSAPVRRDQLTRCVNLAAVRVLAVTEEISAALSRDSTHRSQGTVPRLEFGRRLPAIVSDKPVIELGVPPPTGMGVHMDASSSVGSSSSSDGEEMDSGELGDNVGVVGFSGDYLKNSKDTQPLTVDSTSDDDDVVVQERTPVKFEHKMSTTKCISANVGIKKNMRTDKGSKKRAEGAKTMAIVRKETVVSQSVVKSGSSVIEIDESTDDDDDDDSEEEDDVMIVESKDFGFKFRAS